MKQLLPNPTGRPSSALLGFCKNRKYHRQDLRLTIRRSSGVHTCSLRIVAMFITKSRYSASTMIVLVARLKVRAQERERERERESARALIAPSAFRRAQIALSLERKISAGFIILIVPRLVA